MKRVLITGAAGFIGARLLERLAGLGGRFEVTGTDLREPRGGVPAGARFKAFDLRDRAALDALVAEVKPDSIVHLASIVTPPKGMSRQDMWDIDVGATQALLEIAVARGVSHFVITTSGASYGYYADNAAWLTEKDPIRGNEVFAYSDHKRQIEERLATFREKHPSLRQLVLRPGTVLGKSVNNQITDLFRRPRVMALRGYPSPFVFIWDEDLLDLILHGLDGDGRTGIFNVAGDGALSLAELATLLNKPLVELPAWLVTAALTVLHPLGLSQYGPEQTLFLKYRPVLSNTALKTEFGYTPKKTSREAFLALLEAQPDLKKP